LEKMKSHGHLLKGAPPQTGWTDGAHGGVNTMAMPVRQGTILPGRGTARRFAAHLLVFRSGKYA
jgi:hypothetical protein